MRFKSILGAFIFLWLASFVAMVIFVQTKTFGRIASKVISDISHRRADAKITVKSLAISLLPPGIEFNQVKIHKNLAPDKKIFTEFGKLGFYVGLIELEEKKLTLGEIRISDSVIDYTAPEDNEPTPEKIDKKIINQIFDFSNKMPLRVDTLLLENTRLFFNHDLIEAKRLKLFKRGDNFIARFHLANLKPLKDSALRIDEIWGDAQIGREDINIYRLKVQHDVHSLLLKGKLKNYHLLKGAEINLTGESHLFLQNLKNHLSLPEMIKFEAGFAHLSFKGQIKDKKINGTIEAAISEMDSNLFKAEQLITQLSFNEKNITLEKFLLKNKTEKLILLEPKKIFDFNNKQYLREPLTVRAENLELNNVLGVLPSLKVLKGKLNGELTFSMFGKDMEFKPKDGFLVNNLGLVVGDDKPFTILMIKRAKLTSANFKVIDSEFQMDSLIELNHSLLDVHGKVNSKRVSFNVNDAVVDLEDFGNISQLDIKGKGVLDINVAGDIDDVVINLKGKTKGFEVLGYRLGQSDKDLSIALKDSEVIINKFESLYRTTPISGTGAINWEANDIALGINSPKASLSELKEILYPIFSKLDFLPADLDLVAKVDADINGKTSLNGLKVKAETQFTDLTAFGETFNSGQLNISLSNQLLRLRDFVANKGKGQIRGDFAYSLKSEQMKINYDWDELALASFAAVKKAKLNLNGVLSGFLFGEGTTSDYNLQVQAKMDETKSQDHNFEDSLVKMNLSPSSIRGDLNLLGQMITSTFDYAPKQDRKSRINLKLNTPSIKPFLVALLGQQLETKEFSGSLGFTLDTTFRGAFQEVDLKATLQNLSFRHENFNLNYSSTQPQFVIDENQVKKWNLSIQESDVFIATKGRGEFGRDVSLYHEFHLNSRIFEILLASVLSAEGFVRNSLRIDGDNNKYHLNISSKASDLDLTVSSVPFPLNDINYSVDFSNRRLVIHDLRSTLENGSVRLHGDIFFDGDNPDINLKYVLDKAEIPILGKSLLNLSGEGIMLGNEPPYTIGGEIIVNKANIVNELNEFNSKSNALSQVRFLPQNQESQVGKFLILNLNVKAENPVRITNSLMDVSLKGELMLLGSPTRPRAEGRLFAPNNSSRIFFKNNEYSITNADLNFTPKKEISNPDFDIQALTLISSYKVQIKAYGDLERFNFDLTSDPSLTRNSILSLIAFGYTDEIQSSLTQGEQQNLTQVGVGSFVFDRFKISDILNKQFGLQVNLGTVFEQSQTDSLLSGRTTQDGQGTLGIGRTRSATKIELKKRLDEALSLSVSSTMGGSIGQRQSMNLNYSINKKVQLEGVYELRTNEEGLEDVIDNSIGGDLKFRWTFK
jgi:translocation and assembly module TamB